MHASALLSANARARLLTKALQHQCITTFLSSRPPPSLSRTQHLRSISATSGSGSDDKSKRRIIFLGTPEVAAATLHQLLDAAGSGAGFEVAGVVTQPGRPKGRGKKGVPDPSPVEAAALQRGISPDAIMCPVSAREEDFLQRIVELQPDLCVTAAYGNILPQRFLDIPRFGTLNIHPSLLPRFRGAAPVQRALQAGVAETGVSVAFTVRAMDAGPILAQERVIVAPNVQAPELLSDLFYRGTRLLLQHMDLVWCGRAEAAAKPQDAEAVTHAAKMTKMEGVLDLRQPAQALHNQVRAFAEWPGTAHTFHLDDGSAARSELQMKLIRTSVECGVLQISHLAPGEVGVSKEALLLICGDGSVLKVVEVQPVGKKVMLVAAFVNGLKGRRIFV